MFKEVASGKGIDNGGAGRVRAFKEARIWHFAVRNGNRRGREQSFEVIVVSRRAFYLMR